MAMAATSAPAARTNGLNKLNHIVVILQENWSFDSLYAEFPGANGIAEDGPPIQQLDKQNQPYTTLPQPKDTNQKPIAADGRCMAASVGRSIASTIQRAWRRMSVRRRCNASSQLTAARSP